MASANNRKYQHHGENESWHDVVMVISNQYHQRHVGMVLMSVEWKCDSM